MHGRQPEFETQRYADHYWRTTVKRPGKVVYHFSFQILDRHRQLRGYFQWDRSSRSKRPDVSGRLTSLAA
ncbi:AidA/PixA family protein [Streptomyces tibetensis]|uniref:AidA/PixA family protein n=1 Tax=Streptomyces tibetensis TaxID=2382123 RepID=UPI0033CA6A88